MIIIYPRGEAERINYITKSMTKSVLTNLINGKCECIIRAILRLSFVSLISNIELEGCVLQMFIGFY